VQTWSFVGTRLAEAFRTNLYLEFRLSCYDWKGHGITLVSPLTICKLGRGWVPTRNDSEHFRAHSNLAVDQYPDGGNTPRGDNMSNEAATEVSPWSGMHANKTEPFRNS
jgi:hypothetical protein